MSVHINEGQNVGIAMMTFFCLFIISQAVIYAYFWICGLNPAMCGLDYADLESMCYKVTGSSESICFGSTKMCPIMEPVPAN